MHVYCIVVQRKYYPTSAAAAKDAGIVASGRMIDPIKHRMDCDMKKRNASDEVIMNRMGVVSSILKTQ
jgi:hypothetical protein